MCNKLWINLAVSCVICLLSQSSVQTVLTGTSKRLERNKNKHSTVTSFRAHSVTVQCQSKWSSMNRKLIHFTQQRQWSTASSSAGLTTVTVCWQTAHSVLSIGFSGWWMQQRDLSAILVGWHPYLVCYATHFIGCVPMSETATSSVF